MSSEDEWWWVGKRVVEVKAVWKLIFFNVHSFFSSLLLQMTNYGFGWSSFPSWTILPYHHLLLLFIWTATGWVSNYSRVQDDRRPTSTQTHILTHKQFLDALSRMCAHTHTQWDRDWFLFLSPLWINKFSTRDKCLPHIFYACVQMCVCTPVCTERGS